MAVAASFSLRPTSPASERSTLTFRVGCWKACWMRASAMPGIVLDPGQQLVGVFAVRLHVVADDLQVDRRGRAEIQDLADHVGRQESEGGAGKLPRQLLAHRLDVVRRRRVASA